MIFFKITDNLVTGYEQRNDETNEVPTGCIECTDESLITPFEPQHLVYENGAVRAMTQAERDAIPVPIVFNRDDVDDWLVENFLGTAIEPLFSFVARATEKNTPRGYEILRTVAEGKGVDDATITMFEQQLKTMGANINV